MKLNTPEIKQLLSKHLTWKTILAAKLIKVGLFFALMSGSSSRAAPSSDITPWLQEADSKNPIFARVHLDPRGEKRMRDLKDGQNDFKYYSLNEEGLIQDSDLLSALGILSQSEFDSRFWLLDESSRQFLLSQKKTTQQLNEDSNQAVRSMITRDPIPNITTALAALQLNRILDHEAMKRKFPPHAAEWRTRQVARALLLTHALKNPNGLTRDQIRGQSSVNLYEKFRMDSDAKWIGLRNLDWSDDLNGMLFLQSSLDRYNPKNEPVPFPKAVSIRIEQLPESYFEFEIAIQAKLDLIHRSLMRSLMLQSLLQETNPFLPDQIRYHTDNLRLLALYETQRQRFETPWLETSQTVIHLQGARASEARVRFLNLLESSKKQKILEFFGDDRTPTREQILIARKETPLLIFNQIKKEYQNAIQAGLLDISIEELQNQRTLNPPPVDTNEPFPTWIQADDSGSTKIVVYQEVLMTSERSATPFTDPQVQSDLSKTIASIEEATAMKDLLIRLFQRNHLELNAEGLERAHLEKIDTSPRVLSEALYQQVYRAFVLPNP